MKYRGFEDSLEYRSMPKWLKRIYIYVYKSNPKDFADFLEKAKDKPKDFLKKALKRNNVQICNLTKEKLEKELFR